VHGHTDHSKLNKKFNEFLPFASCAKLMYYFSCTARMEKRTPMAGRKKRGRGEVWACVKFPTPSLLFEPITKGN
jgi:hypothetical protein